MPRSFSAEEKQEIFDKSVKPKIATAIGHVVAHWSLLEATLYLMLQTILDLQPQILTMVIAETTFLQKLDMITSLIHHSRERGWFDEWCVLEKEINSVRVKRNDLIHGFWMPSDTESPITIRVKSRGKLSAQKIEKTKDEIEEVDFEVVGVSIELSEFHNKISEGKIHNFIKNPEGAILDRTQSPAVLARDQARAQKRDRKQADRARSKFALEKQRNRQ